MSVRPDVATNSPGIVCTCSTATHSMATFLLLLLRTVALQQICVVACRELRMHSWTLHFSKHSIEA